MGHEIAHALREHSREQLSQAMAAQTAIGVASALLGGWLGGGTSEMANTAYDSVIATKFSTGSTKTKPIASVSNWRRA